MWGLCHTSVSASQQRDDLVTSLGSRQSPLQEPSLSTPFTVRSLKVNEAAYCRLSLRTGLQGKMSIYTYLLMFNSLPPFLNSPFLLPSVGHEEKILSGRPFPLLNYLHFRPKDTHFDRSYAVIPFPLSIGWRKSM